MQHQSKPLSNNSNEVIATVYFISPDKDIVKLHNGSKLYAFGIRDKNKVDLDNLNIGDKFKLIVGERLNKVLSYEKLSDS